MSTSGPHVCVCALYLSPDKPVSSVANSKYRELGRDAGRTLYLKV